MKTCTKCNTAKEFSEFNKRKSAKDGLQHQCRVCEKANHASHYSKNKQRYVDRASVNKKKYIEQYRLWRQSLVCECCSETDSVCIDLHHLDPTKKDFNIANACGNKTMQAVLKEVEKCAVVCSNCHRKIHKYGNDWYYTNKRDDGGVVQRTGLQNLKAVGSNPTRPSNN